MAEKRETPKAAATKKKTAKKAAKKTAKKAVKKTAKKAAKKTAKKVAKKGKSGSVSLTENSSFGEQMSEGLRKINAIKKSRAVHMVMGGDLDLPLIPFKSFLLQWATGMRGLPAQCVIEMIADQGVGKSTMLGHLIGDFSRNGHPCAYFECEGKPPTSEWLQRLASRNKEEGKAINNNMMVASPRSLPEFAEGMKIWAKAVREHTDLPQDKSLIAIVDPWSKLMNQAEAEGVSAFGVTEATKKKQKEREIGTGSNQGHAKWAHEWMRKVTAYMENYNVTIIVVKHQNQEGVMAGGAQYGSPVHNDTAIGGCAIGQNAALRIIGIPGGQWKNYKNERIGTYTRWCILKASFGHPGKEFKTRVRSNNEHWRDTDTHYDVCFDWSEGLANWMAESSHFGTRVDAKRYTCETLGVFNGTEEEFEERFYAPENEDYVEYLGFRLGIYGYEDIQAKRQREAEAEERRKAREEKQAAKELEVQEEQEEAEVKIGAPPEVIPDEPEEVTEEVAVETPPPPANVSGSFGPPTEG